MEEFSEEILAGLQSCLPLGALCLECQLFPLTRVVLATHWKLAPGELHPWSRRERLTVTSLHCMAGEVCADLFTGSLMVPALSILNSSWGLKYLEIFHETIHAMKAVGRTTALWSMWLYKHFQWAVTYLIFKLECPTGHRGTRCALKRVQKN